MEYKGPAIILRRTNYGEADRILALLTPQGQKRALARGVRKERSRLAGGIELLALNEVVLRKGRGELETLTSARMVEYYQNILAELDRFEFAYQVLKKITRESDSVDSPRLFTILREVLAALDNPQIDLRLIKIWFELNLNFALEAGINLKVDGLGNPLQERVRYFIDNSTGTLMPDPKGPIGAPEIKLLRLMAISTITTVSHIKDIDELLAHLNGHVD